MHVFLTGATGFIGQRILSELIAAGHHVTGLARSDEGADALSRSGAAIWRGTLENPETIIAGVQNTDAVIHTAFDHDFSRFVENCAKDRRVITAIGTALEGTRKPFLVTSSTGLGNTEPGIIASEDVFNATSRVPRVASELAAEDMLARGINIGVVRLPQVHDTIRQGLVTPLIAIAREKGMSAYVGEGENVWPAAPVSDVARLYRLALENHQPGRRYHAVAEEGVTFRTIAETIAKGLDLPLRAISQDEATAHFGWLAPFTQHSLPASSILTRSRLNWTPTGPTLLEDLANMDYYTAS